MENGWTVAVVERVIQCHSTEFLRRTVVVEGWRCGCVDEVSSKGKKGTKARGWKKRPDRPGQMQYRSVHIACLGHRPVQEGDVPVHRPLSSRLVLSSRKTEDLESRSPVQSSPGSCTVLYLGGELFSVPSTMARKNVLVPSRQYLSFSSRV
jgi:hypothetical protein